MNISKTYFQILADFWYEFGKHHHFIHTKCYLCANLFKVQVVSDLILLDYMFLYDENKPGLSVNELWYRMFTEKNLSGDCLPPILDASVLHLRRALIFFYQYFFNTFSFFFFIYQNIKYRKRFLYFLYIKPDFFLWHKNFTKFFSFKLSFFTHLWHWT